MDRCCWLFLRFLECCRGVLALNEDEIEFMIGNGKKAMTVKNHRLQHSYKDSWLKDISVYTYFILYFEIRYIQISFKTCWRFS